MCVCMKGGTTKKGLERKQKSTKFPLFVLLFSPSSYLATSSCFCLSSQMKMILFSVQQQQAVKQPWRAAGLAILSIRSLSALQGSKERSAWRDSGGQRRGRAPNSLGPHLSLFFRQHWVIKQCLHDTFTNNKNGASIYTKNIDFL